MANKKQIPRYNLKSKTPKVSDEDITKLIKKYPPKIRMEEVSKEI